MGAFAADIIISFQKIFLNHSNDKCEFLVPVINSLVATKIDPNIVVSKLIEASN